MIISSASLADLKAYTSSRGLLITIKPPLIRHFSSFQGEAGLKPRFVACANYLNYARTTNEGGYLPIAGCCGTSSPPRDSPLANNATFSRPRAAKTERLCVFFASLYNPPPASEAILSRPPVARN